MSEPIDETQRTYDLITREFARRTATVQQHVVDHVETLTSRLPGGSVVADIGCGPGNELRLLRQRLVRVIGLDLSIGQLRSSKLAEVGFITQLTTRNDAYRNWLSIHSRRAE